MPLTLWLTARASASAARSSGARAEDVFPSEANVRAVDGVSFDVHPAARSVSGERMRQAYHGAQHLGIVTAGRVEVGESG